MTNTSKPILFFGTEEFSAVCLRALIDAGYDIRAVVTKPDSKKGRGQSLHMPSVKTVALEHDIDVWQPAKLSDIREAIGAISDVTGVLVSYGKIIPGSIIELFSPGIINLHPSLLPKYRGPSPIESAIMNGDEKTGVSIMQLTAEMDAGPVYSQIEITLTGNETQPELYARLASSGSAEILRALPEILDNSLLPTQQDESQATYCQLLSKSDSLLDPTQLTAVEAERRVRACMEFPKSKILLGDEARIVTKAHVSKDQKTPLDVVFRDGDFLSIDELVAPSGKTMNAEAFLRGYLG